MAVAQAQWETAFGDTFATTPKLHYFERGDTVWRKSDFGVASNWDLTKKYTVHRVSFYTFDDAGTEKIADSTLTTEASNGGTQPSDTTSPFFYSIKRVSDGHVVADIHESQLLGESAMETYLQSQVTTQLE